jgi:flagellar motility protein MotE (MotC chaperone)
MKMRPRIMPVLVGTMALLVLLKAEALWQAAVNALEPLPAARPMPRALGLNVIGPAVAADDPPPPRPAAPPAPAPPAAAAAPPDPAVAAERAVLDALRERRAGIDQREQALVVREVMFAAAERRLQTRVAELVTMRDRLEALERSRGERDDAGWRGLVRVYEGMRPRDAAAIFDDLEMPVLVQVMDRMGERKAAPVLGAMRPERARQLTTELARHRAQRNPNE